MSTESQPQTTESQPQTETKVETNSKAEAGSKTSGKAPAAKKSKTSYKHVDLPINEETKSMTKKDIDEFFEKEVR